MEGMGYAAAAADLCVAGVGAPHIRQRLYWLTHPVGMQQWREKPCSRQAGRMGRVIKPFSWDCGWESALRQFRSVDDGLSYGVGVTDGFRNAIVPPLAQAFIEANLNLAE
jgi:DNA (cytosine-5)-methyltransferase 1